MTEKENLLLKSIFEKEVQIVPNNKNYTNPRTYGVYEILQTHGANKFRFGNHPVRENELIREFDNVKRIGLFLDREDAKHLAYILNQ